MTIRLTRRDVVGSLVLTAGLGPARATTGEMQAAILAFTGGVVPQAGKVMLNIAPLVENGNSVAVSVSVDHPMRPDAYVASIALFTEKNPQPNVATFHLSPRSGRAFVATRMRLATSQHVAAVARLSDGSLWSDIREVIVTIAACTEE